MSRFDIFAEDSEAIIPSESSIKVAKERRELLRKTGVSGEDDFISLSVVRRSEDQGPHPESRLMREEDEVGDADDGLYTYPHPPRSIR
jgi:GC-rich sequence DNA-binding factor